MPTANAEGLRWIATAASGAFRIGHSAARADADLAVLGHVGAMHEPRVRALFLSTSRRMPTAKRRRTRGVDPKVRLKTRLPEAFSMATPPTRSSSADGMHRKVVKNRLLKIDATLGPRTGTSSRRWRARAPRRSERPVSGAGAAGAACSSAPTPPSRVFFKKKHHGRWR